MPCQDSKRCRAYCFTINNYTEEDMSLLNALNYTYIICGYEGESDGKTPHIQGFVYLRQPMTITALKKFIPRGHIEVKSPNSTFEQASDYCKKEGGFDEDGVLPHQGKRTDLENVVEKIKKKSTIKEIALEYPVTYIKYYKGIEKLRAFYIEDRVEPPEVIVYYGPTGSGKSYNARRDTVDPYVWTPCMEKWFDGYDGQLHAIFEEFRGQLPLGVLLSVLDRYSVDVNIKGRSFKFVANRIIITSPVHPLKWYPSLSKKDGKIDQLMRRITKIFFLSNSNPDSNAWLHEKDDSSETSSVQTDIPETFDRKEYV